MYSIQHSVSTYVNFDYVIQSIHGRRYSLVGGVLAMLYQPSARSDDLTEKLLRPADALAVRV